MRQQKDIEARECRLVLPLRQFSVREQGGQAGKKAGGKKNEDRMGDCICGSKRLEEVG